MLCSDAQLRNGPSLRRMQVGNLLVLLAVHPRAVSGLATMGAAAYMTYWPCK